MVVMGKIVVGVDGSLAGRRALDWALEEARLRGVSCELVHVWDYGLAAMAFTSDRTFERISEDAQSLLDQDLGYAKASGVPVEGELAQGDAAEVLAARSLDADLLVVGSRGRSALAGTLLGSVSTACVHHAACPVVIVRPDEHAGVTATSTGEAAAP